MLSHAEANFLASAKSWPQLALAVDQHPGLTMAYGVPTSYSCLRFGRNSLARSCNVCRYHKPDHHKRTGRKLWPLAASAPQTCLSKEISPLGSTGIFALDVVTSCLKSRPRSRYQPPYEAGGRLPLPHFTFSPDAPRHGELGVSVTAVFKLENTA